jgi:hypothetical protein
MGWDVTVYRQRDGDVSPATADSPAGQYLAEWHEGWLDWLDKLVEAGKAIDLGGNGYPCRYTVIAEYLVPRIIEEDQHSHKYFGKPAADLVAVAQCRPDEWLMVDAWDSS